MTYFMDQLYIPVILGTGREGRGSEAAAKFVVKQAEAAGISTELIDVRDLPSPITARVSMEGFDAGEIGEKMKKADGYIIVAPEYNHSFPGELKIFLDHFYDEYDRKAVGICATSMGGGGGLRMIESLRIVFGALNVAVPKRTVQFPHVQEGVDEEKAAKPVQGMLEELAWFASALKKARND